MDFEYDLFSCHFCLGGFCHWSLNSTGTFLDSEAKYQTLPTPALGSDPGGSERAPGAIIALLMLTLRRRTQSQPCSGEAVHEPSAAAAQSAGSNKRAVVTGNEVLSGTEWEWIQGWIQGHSQGWGQGCCCVTQIIGSTEPIRPLA